MLDTNNREKIRQNYSLNFLQLIVNENIFCCFISIVAVNFFLVRLHLHKTQKLIAFYAQHPKMENFHGYSCLTLFSA